MSNIPFAAKYFRFERPKCVRPIVPAQRPRMLAGSIMDNLRYGNPDASETDVKHAAGLVGIDDFIEDLPAGYDTEIGEKGVLELD